MRKILTASLVAINVLIFQGSATDAEQRSEYVVYGPWKLSCGAFTAARVTDRQVYQWWVQGFVSGVDYVDGQSLAETDGDGVKGWVEKYCADRPLDDFVQAAHGLVIELKNRTRR